MSKTHTGGNVIVEEIKVGDIHYECEYGMMITCEVLELPRQNESGQWYWTSKDLNTYKIIDYLVSPEHSHYAPKLYDYKAYGNSEDFNF